MIRLGIRVRAADAEIAFARLEPVLAGGAEEVELGEAVEFAVYGEDVPDARLRELAGDTLIAVTREPVDPGWDRAWHEHIEPVTVAWDGALTVTLRAPETVLSGMARCRMELENGHFAERLQSDEVKQAIVAFFAAREKAPAT